MKSYAYTFGSKWDRCGYWIHTAHLYRIKRNKLVLIDTMTRSFVTEFQLVMMILKEHKELPQRVFGHVHSAWTLKDKGIADVQRI